MAGRFTCKGSQALDLPCTCIACLTDIAISDVGTRDYTAYCAVNDAFKFRERFGDKEIIHYINKLARDGGELIVSTQANRHLTSSALTTVRAGQDVGLLHARAVVDDARHDQPRPALQDARLV